MGTITNYDREELVAPIERMFEREFQHTRGKFESWCNEDDIDESKVADIVFVERRPKALHAVLIEPTYDECVFDVDSGLYQLGWMQANYRWIAMPIREYRNGEETYNHIIEEMCKKRGYGVIATQRRGRGISAKIVIDAEYQDGYYVTRYMQDKKANDVPSMTWQQPDFVKDEEAGEFVKDEEAA